MPRRHLLSAAGASELGNFFARYRSDFRRGLGGAVLANAVTHHRWIASRKAFFGICVLLIRCRRRDFRLSGRSDICRQFAIAQNVASLAESSYDLRRLASPARQASESCDNNPGWW